MNPFERTFGPSADSIESSDTMDVRSTQAGIVSQQIASHATLDQSIDSSDSKEIAERISSYKERFSSKPEQKRPASKKLVLGQYNDIAPMVCEKTGIVYALLFPAVPGKTLETISPFASYKTCRSLVQEGAAYLARLSNQQLAGIFLTMADHYDLLRTSGAATAASSNALLRTVDKSKLIDALLMIETWINSSNAQWIAKLSLIPTPEIIEKGLNYRFTGWLQSAVDCVYKPDRESYEDAVSLKRTISVPSVAAARKEAAQAKKEFNAWKKGAKDNINTLYTGKVISLKLKTYLTAILDEKTIESASEETINLLALKLSGLNNEDASELAESIKGYWKLFAKKSEADILDEEGFGPSFASQPVGSSLERSTEPKPNHPKHPNNPESSDSSDSIESIESIDSVDSVDSIKNDNPVQVGGRLSFKDRIALLKASKRQENDNV